MATSSTGPTATVSCAFCGTLNRVNMARAGDRPKCGECAKPILLDRPLKVSDEDFARVVSDAGVPVLVDFYADWCGPCKMMAPVLDDFARDKLGEVIVAKLDTDRNQATAAKFGIRSIPTLIVFRDGNEASREMGAVSKQRLEALVNGGAGQGG